MNAFVVFSIRAAACRPLSRLAGEGKTRAAPGYALSLGERGNKWAFMRLPCRNARDRASIHQAG
ncbi:MAG: hypothetical protein LBF51_09640 [Zoogloeaceae bacterium]|nr:hypothetical protein [Zoogloeaceae bacterium]